MAQQKYFINDAQRRLIRERYDSHPETIDALMPHFPGIPRWQVRRWAQREGMARTKERPWTVEEEEYLAHVLYRQSWRRIARRLNRTVTAVQLKAKRLGLRQGAEGYTMQALCQALGVDHHKLERWIAKGWLKGQRRQSDREQDLWYFSEAAVRTLFISHPDEIDPRALHRAGSWLWFIDVLVKRGLGALGGEP